MATAEALRGQLLAVFAEVMVHQQLGLQPQGLADLHPAETSTMSAPNKQHSAADSSKQHSAAAHSSVQYLTHELMLETCMPSPE